MHSAQQQRDAGEILPEPIVQIAPEALALAARDADDLALEGLPLLFGELAPSDVVDRADEPGRCAALRVLDRHRARVHPLAGAVGGANADLTALRQSLAHAPLMQLARHLAFRID